MIRSFHMNQTTIFATRFLIADNDCVIRFPLVSTRGTVNRLIGIVAVTTLGLLIAIAAIRFLGISHHLFCVSSFSQNSMS
jgi:hypothetical protein